MLGLDAGFDLGVRLPATTDKDPCAPRKDHELVGHERDDDPEDLEYEAN
jgi:hypothetical protein